MGKEMTEEERKARNKKRRRALEIAGLVILLILLFRGCGGCGKTQDIVDNNTKGILDADGEKGDGKPDFDASGCKQALNNATFYVNMQISTYVNIVNGEGTFDIYNGNAHDMQVVLFAYDKDSKEMDEENMLYVSPLLHPGESVGKGSLSNIPENGQYNTIAMFRLFGEEGNFLGEAGQEVLLNVN